MRILWALHYRTDVNMLDGWFCTFDSESYVDKQCYVESDASIRICMLANIPRKIKYCVFWRKMKLSNIIQLGLLQPAGTPATNSQTCMKTKAYLYFQITTFLFLRCIYNPRNLSGILRTFLWTYWCRCCRFPP